jgi:hypothetical protein
MIDRLRDHGHLGFPLLIAAIAFAVQREVLSMPLLGHDTYPAIIASRIQNFSDFIGTFTEVLMDGRLWAGDFYRPIGNLFLAFDYLCWEMSSTGYQLTSLAVWCAAIVALYLLCRRLLGGTAWMGPSFAAIVFALHPAALSVLPYPGRRTEMLMLLFVALALLALPQTMARTASPKQRRQFWIAGAMTLLAVASKETGVIAVALVFLQQFSLVSGNGLKDRLLYASRASLPAGLLAAGVLFARFLVIGGVGGYHERASENATFLSKVFLFAPGYLSATFTSGSLDAPGLRDLATLVSVCAIVLLALRHWHLSRRRKYEHEVPLSRVPATLMIGGAWLITSTLLACLSLNSSPRYLIPMTFAAALLLGALAEGAVAIFRRGEGVQRIESTIALFALAAIALVALGGSAIRTDYPELRRAKRTHAQLLDAFRERIADASPHEVILASLPDSVPVEASAVDDLWLMAPWSLEAWLELEYPDRSYEVSVTPRPPELGRGYWPVMLMPGSRSTLD